ncbi:MAG TPA: hypothetical protein VND93_07450 [Myxococcales bacterium]|nr:hypothetical protein [Myxococcales bacterium]
MPTLPRRSSSSAVFVLLLLAAAAPATAAPQAVGFNNLTTLSRIDFNPNTKEGGRGNAVAGSKIPHANMHFDFSAAGGGPADAVYNVDTWTNAGGVPANLTKGIHNLRVGKRNYQALVDAWDGNQSIFDPVLSGYIFDDSNPANWMKPAATDGDKINLQLKEGLALNSEFTRYVAMHLISMRAAIFWREATNAALSGNIRYTKRQSGKPDSDESVTVDWKNIIRQARLIVKSKLHDNAALFGTGQPSSNPAVGPQYDALMTETLTHDDGFKKLMDLGMIKISHGAYDPATVPIKDPANGTIKNQLVNTDEINQPLNHIRFLLYIEWRGMRELINAE